MRAQSLVVAVLVTLLAFDIRVAGAQNPAPDKAHGPLIPYDRLFHPVYGEHGMVASQEAVASRIGADVLRQGGNAVDAAVAMGFALAVTLPRAGNIGGGGFMLVHLAGEGRTLAIDYRETAPGAVERNIFLDGEGNVDVQRLRYTVVGTGVPGTVAGLLYALEHYGTWSRAKAMAPAIRLASEGIIVTHSLARALERAARRLKPNPAAARVFYHSDGSFYRPGERLVQKDLAATLKAIARDGADAFYKGEIAAKLVAEMRRQHGLITAADLAAYRAVERAPVIGRYRGFVVASMPPPSSGGVHLIEMLNILEGFRLRDLGPNTAATLHLMTETMKLAFADRSKYLGDPDFVSVPVARLISKDYAARLRATIPTDRARPSREIRPGLEPMPESRNTTHFSVVDRWGNAVANTYTLNFSFGNGVMVEGAGFLLNNEMDDFAAAPGVPNAFGLTGGEANAVEPGKRPLSSMTPTIVLKDGRPWLVTGSPGGPRIITTVLQIILNVVDHGMDIAAATYAPRIHHQWLPDKLLLEPGISLDTARLLEAMGHKVVYSSRALGAAESVQWKDGIFYGVADPRREGAAAVGY